MFYIFLIKMGVETTLQSHENESNILLESEYFMNQLCALASTFEPLCDENWNNMVYFDITKENGIITRCVLHDRRINNNPNIISHLSFYREPNWSYYDLNIHKWWEKVKTWPGKCDYFYRSKSRSISNSNSGYCISLPDLLKSIENKLAGINSNRHIEKAIWKLKLELANTLAENI